MASINSSRSVLVWVVAVLFVLSVFLLFLPERIVEYLWMENLGYTQVFWTLLLVRTGLFLGILAVVLAYFGINFRYIQRQLPLITTESGELGVAQVGDVVLTKQRFALLGAGVAAFFGLLFATSFSLRWEELIRYLNSSPTGETDPLFGADMAFYLLELPFIEAVQGGLVGIFFIGLLVFTTVFFMTGQIAVRQGQVRVAPGVLRLMGINLALFLLAWGWGFYLDRFGLLLSESGAVYGASYLDVNVRIPALWAATISSVLLAALVAYVVYVPRIRLLLLGGGAYFLILVAGLGVIPAIVNQITVQPNELELEMPHLERNIQGTRAAYGLSDVRERSYPAEGFITREQLDGNEDVIENIRLWDPDLLIRTYQQLQEIRLYYEFYNVDVDRYLVDDDYRQVLIGARELTQNLPERTDSWINRHLRYTHGQGITMNFATEIDEEGNPELFVQDIPPQTETDLEIDETSIYYGERTPGYRIVNTGIAELNYPGENGNVHTNYDGVGGVQFDAFWKRMLFAWYMSDFNIVLSDYLHEGSRIQFWNRVRDRVERIAPFLEYDGDPYVVLSEGRVYWIQDAYTTANSYPYSEPAPNQRFNYMRNSVKVVIDAYDGTVDFYQMEEEPLVDAYASAFPDLFKPFEEMPEDLQQHVRYPEDLFYIQVELYQRYHMTNPEDFYNNEDLWTRPSESYDGRQQIMEPYYMLMRLPDEEGLEFFLMTPMTPSNRENMVGWLAARSDPDNYGQLISYNLPRERLIYGPNQIESRIDQDTEISRQVTLWDQAGSRVVRGNLLVVPIQESFLYVEPVYLIADNIEIPQLRRVIVSDGRRVVMEPSLEQGLARLYGDPVIGDTPLMPVIGEAPGAAPAGDMQRAREVFREVEEALSEGDFASFGSSMNELAELLGEPEEFDPDEEEELLLEEEPPSDEDELLENEE